MRENGQKKGGRYQARSCLLKECLNFIPVKAPKGGAALRRGEKAVFGTRFSERMRTIG